MPNLRSTRYAITASWLALAAAGPAPALPLVYGWDPELDEGIDYDWLVDMDIPVSSGNVKKTAAEAIAASAAGDTIRVRDRGDPYRELPNFTGKSGVNASNRTRFLGYADEKPMFSAANELTGAIPCVVGDAAVLGAIWPNCYKVVGFPKANIANASPRALNLYEADPTVLYVGRRAMVHAISRANNGGDDYLQRVNSSWWTADNFYTVSDAVATSNTEDILGIRDDSVTTLFTQSQLLNADVMFQHYSNHSMRSAILDATVGGILHVVDTSGKFDAGTPYQKAWALINILPAMQQGGYGYVDGGGSTIDIYFWPYNPIHVNNGIEYSAREDCCNISSANWVEIASLIFVQAATDRATFFGCGIKTTGGTAGAKTGLVIRNNYLGEHTNTVSSSDGYGVIALGQCVNTKVWNNTIKNARGMMGIGSYGGSLNGDTLPEWLVTPPDFGYRNDIRYNHVEHVEQSPLRFYTQREQILAFNSIYNCGRGSHTNKTNLYSQSTDNLNWGNVYSFTYGYMTGQGADNNYWIMNSIPSDPGGITPRAVVDQNDTFPTPQEYLGGMVTSMFWNNTCPPDPVVGYPYNVSLGQSSLHPLVFWEMVNNIIDDDNDTHLVQVSKRDFNIFTQGTAPGPNGTTSNVVDIYTNLLAYDYAIRAGSTGQSKRGLSMQPRIDAILKPRFGAASGRLYPFTDADFTTDAAGQTFSWNDAPVGCIRQRPIVADTAAPIIKELSPADGASAAAIDAPLRIILDEAVQPVAGNVLIKKLSDNSTIETVAIGACIFDLNVIEVPHADFANGEGIYIQITAGAFEDLSGNDFPGILDTTTWNFNVVAVAFSPYEVDNNGSGRLNRLSSSVFSADDNKITFALLMRPRTSGSDGGAQNFLTFGANSSITRPSSGKVRLRMVTSAGSALIDVPSTANFNFAGGLQQILLTADTGVAPAGKIYMNGVDVTGVFTAGPLTGTMDLSSASILNLLASNGGTVFPLFVKYIYIKRGVIHPISNFWAGGVPITPPADNPEVYYFDMDDASKWAAGTNDGTGGNFTVTGTFS